MLSQRERERKNQKQGKRDALACAIFRMSWRPIWAMKSIDSSRKWNKKKTPNNKIVIETIGQLKRKNLQFGRS